MDMDDDSGMTMSMTFSSWGTYKVSILFSSWEVSSKWEFTLSCFAIILATIIYHAVRYLIYILEDFMYLKTRQGSSIIDRTEYTKVGEPNLDDERVTATDMSDASVHLSAARYLLLRAVHSVLSGLNYGLALMLMLVAMTYNPTLFLMLMIGYALGDFIFFAKIRDRSQGGECH